LQKFSGQKGTLQQIYVGVAPDVQTLFVDRIGSVVLNFTRVVYVHMYISCEYVHSTSYKVLCSTGNAYNDFCFIVTCLKRCFSVDNLKIIT